MNRGRRESTWQWFAALLLLAGTSLFAAEPVVESVSFQERPGTKLVDITYTVSDADNDNLTIKASGQDADGSVSLSTLSGDGASGTVKPGTHTLTWDAGADYPGGLDENVQIKLTASDSQVLVPEMVYVEAGTHNGTDWGNDEPMSITIDEPFYIGKCEATNDQVASVFQWAYNNGKIKVNATSNRVTNAQGDSKELLDLDSWDGATGTIYSQISFSNNTFSADDGKENYPCIMITWFGAAAYCNYLSESQGLTPAYDMTGVSDGDYRYSDWTLIEGANGFRLLSDAQWEYAARGGKDGNNTEYSGSDIVGDVAWHKSNSGYRSHEVGTRAANELGVYDMSGNVWEWCHDWHPEYVGIFRVVRGGRWDQVPDYCRVSHRYGSKPCKSYYYGFGFRLSLPAGQ